ncbi:MAG: hypothetical protein WD077_06320 [Bacteroidia bacterium]
MKNYLNIKTKENKSTLRSFSLFTLILIINIAGCKPREEAPEYPLQPEFMAAMYFQEGTWWVYEDTASGASDSAVVTSDTRVYVDEYNRDVLQSKRETFQYTIEHPALGRRDRITGESTCERGESGKRCGFAIHTREDISSDWTYLYFYPPAAGTRSEAPSGMFVTITEILPVVQIAGQEFHNVIEIHDPMNSVESGLETYYLIAQGTGIIQKRILQPGGEWQVWELARWNVVQ